MLIIFPLYRPGAAEIRGETPIVPNRWIVIP